jgi:hypothetical protein
VADQESMEMVRATLERVESEIRQAQAQIDTFAQSDVASFYVLAAMRERVLLGYIRDLAAAIRVLTD